MQISVDDYAPHLRMRYAYGFNQMLERVGRSRTLLEFHVSFFDRKEIVQLPMETEPCANATHNQPNSATTVTTDRPGISTAASGATRG